MPIRVKCSGCGRTIKGGDDWAGKTANCPHCSTIVEFPARATFVSPDEPPEAWLGVLVPPLPPLVSAESPPAWSPVSTRVVEYARLKSHPPILTTEKRILPAFLLAFFFGGLGAHRFYAGRARSATVLLTVTLLSSAFVIFNSVVGVIQQSQFEEERAQTEQQIAASDDKLKDAFQDLSEEGVERLNELLRERETLTKKNMELAGGSVKLVKTDLKVLLGLLLLVLVGIWIIFDVIQLMIGIFQDGNGVTITQWT
jgi:hypothetical protein